MLDANSNGELVTMLIITEKIKPTLFFLYQEDSVIMFK